MKMFTKHIVLSGTILIGILFIMGCSQQSQDANLDPTLHANHDASLVLYNGKILTVDSENPQAEALAVKDDKILAVGSSEEIKQYIKPNTQTIDLQGKLVIPAFIESHGHLLTYGEFQMRLDFGQAKSWDEIVTTVKQAVEKAKPGEWILGWGWHQEKWGQLPEQLVEGWPLHHTLSSISPDNPVLLLHVSEHAMMVNAKAMELAEVTAETPDPAGGIIVRDDSGAPIGIFEETARDLINNVLNEYISAQPKEKIEGDKRQAIQLAMDECLRKGVATIHDPGSTFETIDLFKKMAEENALDVRIYSMIRESNEQLKERLQDYRIIGMADNHLTVRSVKRSIDGALGAHSAWLLEPYTSLPSSTGINKWPISYMDETAAIALKHGFQLCTHAIGDRANQETLNIYEKAFMQNPDNQDLRWRIEHCQHLHPDDIPRFGKLGIIASIQGVHCTSDGPWIHKRMGEKRAQEGAYMWRELMENGATLCNGTDWPVEDIDPIACFYASVTRKLADGATFYPNQRMTREEALQSYTSNAAYAGFEEKIKGSLTPGKLADIVILSQDIMTVPEEQILETEVLYTIVGGQIKYQK